MARMRMEEVVGRRIRDRRDELGMTQEEFGRRAGHWLGKPWSRSSVSVAENGKRAFTAAELVAVAHVLDTSAAWLLTPAAGTGDIRMPSGAILPVGALLGALAPSEDPNLTASRKTLSLLAGNAARVLKLAQELDGRLARA